MRKYRKSNTKLHQEWKPDGPEDYIQELANEFILFVEYYMACYNKFVKLYGP